MLSMPELVWKFNTFKLRWFPLFAMFRHSMCGPMKDKHVTIPQAAPYYRLFACAHTITQLVWGFRYLDTSYPDKGRLIQKSIVCWDYVPSGNGLRTGKKMSLALSQRCRKNSLRQRLERPALCDEF